ncbi:MAG: hypothetical protein FK733_12745 [Asgard group archaeon]|nr:hypothetical protein [Asgard group archaeon]
MITVNVLIVYYSITGKTKIIAEAIYEGIKDSAKVKLKKLSEFNPTDFNNYDVIFTGAPCHDSDVAKSVKKLLNEIPENPQFKLAGFVTHSCYPLEKGGKYIELFEKWVGKCSKTFDSITKEKKLEFLGFFRCMGAASAPIENFINKEIITDEKEFQEFLIESRKHPDENDIKNAHSFALKIIKALN